MQQLSYNCITAASPSSHKLLPILKLHQIIVVALVVVDVELQFKFDSSEETLLNHGYSLLPCTSTQAHFLAMLCSSYVWAGCPSYWCHDVTAHCSSWRKCQFHLRKSSQDSHSLRMVLQIFNIPGEQHFQVNPTTKVIYNYYYYLLHGHYLVLSDLSKNKKKITAILFIYFQIL